MKTTRLLACAAAAALAFTLSACSDDDESKPLVACSIASYPTDEDGDSASACVLFHADGAETLAKTYCDAVAAAHTLEEGCPSGALFTCTKGATAQAFLYETADADFWEQTDCAYFSF